MPAPTYTHEVRRTNFHAASDQRVGDWPYGASSEVISRHRSLDAAERSARAHRSETCACGCAVVIDLAQEASEAELDAERERDFAANCEIES